MGNKIKINFSFKRIKSADWRYYITIAASTLAAIGILSFDLSALTGNKLSQLETSTLASSSSWHSILANPLFLPYKALEWTVVQFGGGQHVFAVRSVSVIFGLISIWLFMSITRRWFARPVYILATVLFGSSLWLLHFGRLAVPTILFTLAPLIILEAMLWLKSYKRPQMSNLRRLFSLAPLPIIFALTLYVPGIWIIWLYIIFWQRKMLGQLIKKLPKGITITFAAAIVIILLPLIYAFTANSSLLSDWIGLSASGLLSLHRLSLLAALPLHFIIWPLSLSNAQWLNSQVILDAFTAIMVLIGVTFYARNRTLRQTKLLLILFAFGLILYVLSDSNINIWVGPVYILAAAGITYFLSLWKKVFPRNPFAYRGAIILLALAVAMSVFFTTRSYFVAWRYHPQTEHAFTVRI